MSANQVITFSNKQVNYNNLNYYQILELSSNATDEQIKKSFRTLARKSHSDKVSSDNALVDMSTLVEAYKTLIDHNRRIAYDQFLSDILQELQTFELTQEEGFEMTPEDNSKYSATIKLIVDNCFQQALNETKLILQKYGVVSPQYKLHTNLIRLILHTHGKFDDRQYYLNKLAGLIIVPLENNITRLQKDNSAISQIKASQLQMALNEIHIEIYKGYKNTMHVPSSSLSVEREVVNAIHPNIVSILKDYSTRKVIDSQRNLVADIFRGMLGTVVTIFAAIPTAGLVLLSSNFRKGIVNNFFTPKSKALLNNAEEILADPYKFYNYRVK
jgi:curved DNA-binding protein CbpA